MSETYKLDICINDFVGFLNYDEQLYCALQPFLIHKSPFCMQIKSNQILWDRCLAMKKSIKAKSQKLKSAYFGYCYCGVGEFIVPIISNDYVIGVICAGEFNYNYKISEYRIRKIAKQYNIDADSLIKKYLASTRNSVVDINLVNNLLGIVAEYISAVYAALVNTDKIKNPPSVTKLCTETYVLSHALEYIRQNYSNNITVKDVSSFCHCSESYLSHIFKNKMKTSIMKYINKLRIEHAKILLLNSDSSVSEIALKTGFCDPNYFSVVFKRFTGLSPSEYRKKGFVPLKRMNNQSTNANNNLQ
ncbi:MAG TPA: AraC family transcriptional regulator [Clostridiaceae bacterium]|nr:AraC family transcriptional regulator [Clostridiaceae bacterium]